jgi:hypothetical protein
MNRFQFIKKIVFGFGGVSLLGLLSTSTVHTIDQKDPITIKLITTNIAGFRYYSGPENLEYIKIEDSIILQREKTNSFDYYAIEVFWKGQKLGYLPRKHNRIVANLMDSGIIPIANIRYINYDNSDWSKIFIRLEIKSM